MCYGLYLYSQRDEIGREATLWARIYKLISYECIALNDVWFNLTNNSSLCHKTLISHNSHSTVSAQPPLILKIFMSLLDHRPNKRHGVFPNSYILVEANMQWYEKNPSPTSSFCSKTKMTSTEQQRVKIHSNQTPHYRKT